MTTTLTLLDQLRVERAVWNLDALLQDLPGRSRRAIRRELRTNLRAAATEVGAAQAVESLGGVRRLANEYLDAEYGSTHKRPRWLNGFAWAVSVELTVLLLAFVGHSAFMSGIEAGNPNPTGTYLWKGLNVLGITGEASYDAGEQTGFGLSFSLLPLLIVAVAFILGGRTWRLFGAWQRSRRRLTPASSGGGS